MSYIYSRALVAEFLEANCSDTAVSALSSENHMPKPSWWHDRTMEPSRHSRFGMTYAPLTESLGAELLTWFAAGFHAKPIPRRLLEKTLQMISGRKCDGSWQMSLPGTYLPRTSKDVRLTEQQTTSKRWATQSDAIHYLRKTWVQTMYGKGTGYLHTPTCTANFSAPSMQKWPACREFVRVFGKPTPTNYEWLMGWPIGWTELRPLVMDKFQLWQQQHSLFLAANTEDNGE